MRTREYESEKTGRSFVARINDQIVREQDELKVRAAISLDERDCCLNVSPNLREVIISAYQFAKPQHVNQRDKANDLLDVLHVSSLLVRNLKQAAFYNGLCLDERDFDRQAQYGISQIG
jgi:hypothetical protein